MKSFMDEDWTGYDHATIKSMILQEYEEQQCNEKGHQWCPVFVCRTCGESFELGECKMTNKKVKRVVDNVLQQQ